MIDVYKIIPNTTVEGPGMRFCIWVQGCKKHCSGCWAKDTWEFGTGVKYSVDKLFSLIEKKNKLRVLLFLAVNLLNSQKSLQFFQKKIKNSGLSVVCFTGYTLEELKSKNNEDINNFLDNIDLLIDGGFEKENYDLSRPWVGSSNQSFIFLTDRYNEEQIYQYKNKIEVRISQDGKTEINGMGDFATLKQNFCLQLGKNRVK